MLIPILVFFSHAMYRSFSDTYLGFFRRINSFLNSMYSVLSLNKERSMSSADILVHRLPISFLAIAASSAQFQSRYPCFSWLSSHSKKISL